MQTRVWYVRTALALSTISLVFVVWVQWRSWSSGSSSAPCRDKTRVITSEGGEWMVCDHENHQLLERPIGYGRVLVTCACADKDASAPLTEEESRALDEMADAGQKLPTADDLYRSLADAGTR